VAPCGRTNLRTQIVKARLPGAAGAIVDAIRDITKLRGDVQLVARGSLPNDGKVIEDARKYE
jgi:phenylacetate-CoA ligase